MKKKNVFIRTWEAIRFATIMLSCIYMFFSGLIHVMVFDSIDRILAKKNLCWEISKDEYLKIETLKVWDGVLFFDPFIPDAIYMIDYKKCEVKEK